MRVIQKGVMFFKKIKILFCYSYSMKSEICVEAVICCFNVSCDVLPSYQQPLVPMDNIFGICRRCRATG